MFYRLPRFNYYRPESLGEALKLLDELSDYKVIAGGTDLLVDMRIKRYTPKNIIDLGGLRELRYITIEGDTVRIGATTTLQELLESNIIRDKLPLLHSAVYNMASLQIRNIATIGGNLCNASPAADTAPPLLVYNASLRLVSRDGERIVGINEFFKGPRKTAIRGNELLKEIIVHVPENYGWGYEKLGRRDAFTLSIVSVAALGRVENGVIRDVRLALGSVAPVPVRARSVEEYLRGRRAEARVVEEASRLVVNDISPISDVRASAEYRKEMSFRLSIIVLLNALGLGGDMT